MINIKKPKQVIFMINIKIIKNFKESSYFDF